MQTTSQEENNLSEIGSALRNNPSSPSIFVMSELHYEPDEPYFDDAEVFNRYFITYETAYEMCYDRCDAIIEEMIDIEQCLVDFKDGEDQDDSIAHITSKTVGDETRILAVSRLDKKKAQPWLIKITKNPFRSETNSVVCEMVVQSKENSKRKCGEKVTLRIHKLAPNEWE